MINTKSSQQAIFTHTHTNNEEDIKNLMGKTGGVGGQRNGWK